MNISSQSSISIKFTGEEIKSILLDHIKRTAPGFVEKNMKMVEDPFDIPAVEFLWSKEGKKDLKTVI